MNLELIKCWIFFLAGLIANAYIMFVTGFITAMFMMTVAAYWWREDRTLTMGDYFRHYWREWYVPPRRKR
jgi:hypothetical protein